MRSMGTMFYQLGLDRVNTKITVLLKLKTKKDDKAEDNEKY